MKMLSILVADDHPLVRRGVRSLLERQPGWEVLAEAANGREAVMKAKLHRPDIIVLDLGMPELNGVEAARQIHKALPESRILMLTMHDELDFVESSIAAGGAGYVLKSDTEQELVSAVKALANYRTYFTSIAREAMPRRARKAVRKRKSYALSPRELEVVQLLAEGKSNKQIAGMLSISQRTVENHRAKIMRKLHLHSFSELVRYAIRHKIIEG
jgi:DNA-binding NarL/FixJ family response regulator